MRIVIEHFYNTINLNGERLMEDDEYPLSEMPDYERAEIAKKAREKGITVDELSILTDLTNAEVLSLLRL